MIKELCTVEAVKVDSVFARVWEPNKHGIKDIVSTDHGVNINWNLGSTFVPWSNVRYVEQRHMDNFPIQMRGREKGMD